MSNISKPFRRLFSPKNGVSKTRIVVPDGSGLSGDQLADQAHAPTKPLGPTRTLKNAIVLLASIAGAVPVPWVKPVADILIDVLKRFEAMPANHQDSQDIVSYIDRFLFITRQFEGLNANDESVEAFKTEMISILQKLPDTQNGSVAGFINAGEITQIITNLKQDLDKAIQLLQTSLQVSLRIDQVKMFEEFKNRKGDGAEKENLGPGDIEINMMTVKATTKGNVNLQTKGTGRVSANTTDALFKTGKSYLGSTQGARVKQHISNVEIDAVEDIDILVIATGA